MREAVIGAPNADPGWLAIGDAGGLVDPIDLEFAAMLAKRVFVGRLLFRSVPQRMVQFMRRSPRFRALMQDLFAGTQSYSELRGRLMRNLNGTLQEALMQFFLDRVIPSNSRVTT